MPAGTFTVRVEGAHEAVFALRAMDTGVRRNVARAVQVSTLNIHRRARQKLRDEGAVDTGRALASIAWIRVGLDGVVSVDATYGKYIEFGTGPHFPPLDALREWCRRHGMAGLEFVVARHIARVGTPARPFLHPAYQEELPVFRAAVGAAILMGVMQGGKYG